MKRIVVGVDGSEESDRALVWALREGRLRDAGVLAVHVWRIPPLGAMTPVPVVSYAELGQGVLDEAIERVTAELPEELRDVPLSSELKDGPAQRALCDAAEGAELLVVGSRGRGAFEGLVLGSVSLYVSGHAPCPVVVVR